MRITRYSAVPVLALAVAAAVFVACSDSPTGPNRSLRAPHVDPANDFIPSPAQVIVTGSPLGGWQSYSANESGRASTEFWDNASSDDRPFDFVGSGLPSSGHGMCGIGAFTSATIPTAYPEGSTATACGFQTAGSSANIPAAGDYSTFWGTAGGGPAPFMFNGSYTYDLTLLAAYSSGTSEIGYFTVSGGTYTFTALPAFGSKTLNTTVTIPAGANWGLYLKQSIDTDVGCGGITGEVCTNATGSFGGNTPVQHFAMFKNAGQTAYIIGVEDADLNLLPNSNFQDSDYNDYIFKVSPHAVLTCNDPTAANYGGALPCVPGNTPCPAGTFTFNIDGSGNLNIKYDQFPAPNDNSYGVNAVGWPNGHKFSDLVGSDHAGFQLKDPNGVIKLEFNIDYISQVATAPSGYASLGPNGGDGKMLVGTSDGITYTTSLANNLNNINIPGLFNASHVQQLGSVNVLLNSPPTDAAHATYNISDPALAGWDFHDTYYVQISAAKLATLGFNPATWTVEPAADQLHNSPAKPCPPGPATVSATTYQVKDKQVLITLDNTSGTDAFVEALTLNWPSANGKLMQIKLDGDVLYNVATASGPISLTTAQLPTDPNHRKINHNSSDVYTLIFEKNADTNLAHYSGTVTISGTTLTVLPH